MINDLQNYFARFSATDLLTSPIVKKISLTLKMSMDCHFLLFLMANLHHFVNIHGHQSSFFILKCNDIGTSYYAEAGLDSCK